MPPKETDLTHYLQLRLNPATIAEIDGIIATVPELAEYSRSAFIRAAIRYSLYSTRIHQQMTESESRS